MAAVLSLIQRYSSVVPVSLHSVAQRVAIHLDAGWTLPGEPGFLLAIPVSTLGDLRGVLAFIPPLVVVAWEDGNSIKTMTVETNPYASLTMSVLDDGGGALVIDLPGELGFISPLGVSESTGTASYLHDIYPGSTYN